jgi:hypothetical protein
MSKPNYLCTMCKMDFGRKANAKRHDLTQHHGLAEIIRVGDYKIKGIGFHNRNRPSEEDPKKSRLYDVLEKLVPIFEEMEKALSNSSSKDKQKIWGDAIIHAISSPDPVRTMTRSLVAIRKGSSVPRMIDCVAISLGVNRNSAEETLKELLVPAELGW